MDCIKMVVTMNIATPKLIQWKTAEMRGNKPFHGFAVLFFRFLSLFSVAGAVWPSKFASPFNDSRQSLKGLNGAEAESCAGSGKQYLTAAQAAISN